MDVEEARLLGLVNRISAPGALMHAARELAEEIASVSPTSVRLTMQIVHEGDAIADPDEATAAMKHSTAIDRLTTSEDMMEGLTAFAQKRAPAWKNR